MALEQAQKLLGVFKGQVEAGDAGAAGSLLEIKKCMMHFAALPPACGASDKARDELLTARETLEWASLFSLKTGDKKGFDRHMAQLSVYYSDFKEALPESPLRCVIIGLNLLHLLVDSRRAELHAELELIAPEERAEPHIAFAINLEQHLMEGQYAQVLLARESMPSPHYAPFMDKLLDTVRDEIAECSSAAYKTLSIDAACKMLMFSSRAELEDYVRARADESWSIRDDTVVFAGHEEAKAEIQSTELIENTLRYASELERIV